MIIEMENIHKRFPGVHALKGIDFALRKNEVHAIVGENGAGKSTLIKILSGFFSPEEGIVKLNGEEVVLKDPLTAKNLGIGVIYQEFNLIPELTIYENIFLGNEKTSGPIKTVNKRFLINKSKAILENLHLSLDPLVKIKDLGVGSQQMVEICKSLTNNPRILIMDEPTAALSKKEIDELFKLIFTLKEKGVSIIYISHRLEEIYQIADRITILKDGCTVKTINTTEISEKEIVQLMIGRDLDNFYPDKLKLENTRKLLSVRKIKNHKLQEISIDLFAGEILGIYGMMGSGRTEFARALFGADKSTFEKFLIDGERQINNLSPLHSIKKGIGFLTENRKEQGLFLDLNIRTNITIAQLRKLTNKISIKKSQEGKMVKETINELNIKCSSEKQFVKNLSGGNQQKVLFGRWINILPKILILDEPTRGVDVGAKSEIYDLLLKLVQQGYGIIFISSELPEICALANRIVVLKDGFVAGEVKQDDITQEAVLELAI